MAGHLNNHDIIKQWDADLFHRRYKVPVIQRSELAITAEIAERARPAKRVFVLYKRETRAQRAAAKKALDQSLASEDNA